MEENERRRKFGLDKPKVESETNQKEIDAKQKDAELNAQREKEKMNLNYKSCSWNLMLE